MPRYTAGGLLAALRPAGQAYAWVNRAFAEPGPVWYDKPYRLHKTDFIDDLKKLPPDAPVMPYYVSEYAYTFGGYERTARGVYVGSDPGTRPNVVQHGDNE